MNTLNFSDAVSGILDVCGMLWEKSFVDGNGGNVSARVDGGVVCTPTMRSKRGLTREDLCMVPAPAGSSPQRPTSELSSHLAIYEASPEAAAVVHCHPPYTCSFAFTDEFRAPWLSPESALWMGKPAFIPYAPSGSDELAAAIAEVAPASSVMILQNHGLICWGVTIEQAYWKVEVTEHYFKTLHLILSRKASPRYFTEEELLQLEEMRKKML